MKKLYAVLFGLLCHSQLWANVEVTNAWIRSAPPNAQAIAVFMDIANHSMRDTALVSVSAAQYPVIELHRTQNDNGIMKMTEQKYIPLPMHTTTRLQPGSWHIMLLTPTYIPKIGEEVVFTLTFNDGMTKDIRAIVQRGQVSIPHDIHNNHEYGHY